MKFLDGLVDRLFVILGALVFLQGPLFISYYTERLSGHVEELKLQTEEVARIAARVSLSVPEFIGKAGDAGEYFSHLFSRYENLRGILEGLESATVATRPLMFLKGFEPEIFRGTLIDYKPGVPLTIEGFCWAAVGMALFFGLYRLARGGLSRVRRRFI